ncbi:MAG: transglutaminaseTgpA domain-containing protein [Actinomycetota bacterium]
MNPRSLSAETLLPTAVVAAMAVIAAMGFRGIFPDWTFATAAVIGAVGAAAVMLIARWARLVVGEAILLSLVGFVLLGAIAAAGIPTPDAFATFFDGLINGWAEVLSSSPPADLTAEFRVLPFTIAWVGSMLGTEMIRSTRVPGLPALGPVVALAVSLLVTVEDRSVALFQGAAMAVGTVVLGWIQQRLRRRDDTYDEGPTARRSSGLTAAGILLVVIAAVSPVLGPRMPLAEANERFDLRRYQTSPFDPLAAPSPLVQVKAYLQEQNADRVVFRATADVPINRWSLAVHHVYDGVTWAVADARFDAPAEFRQVDSVFPAPTVGTVDGWESVRAEVEIIDLGVLSRGALETYWIPSPGWPLSYEADDPLDVRFNARTGTIAVPSGPSPGIRYSIAAAVPPTESEVALRGAELGLDPLGIALPAGLPPQLRNFAGDVLEGADVGWEQVDALQSRFVDTGRYDSREGSSSARPGHAAFRIGEFLDDPEIVVGFEEQYAAAAAVIARSAEIPARVVVGFRIPDDETDERWQGGTADIVAEDISAWIEVFFEDVGWLPFDVTPPRDREPDDIPTGTSEREVAIPNPPPPPPPAELPPRFEEEEEFDEVETDDEEEAESDGALGGLDIDWRVAGATGIPLVLIVGGVMLIVMLKARRRRRRRTRGPAAQRVAGAWYEFLDRTREFGLTQPSTATPSEFARGLDAAGAIEPGAAAELLRLARRADEAAYHPSPPDDDAAAQAWTAYDGLVAAVGSGKGVIRRLRARIDPRPLLQRDPVLTARNEDV